MYVKLWRIRQRDVDHGPFELSLFSEREAGRMSARFNNQPARFPTPWREGLTMGPNDRTAAVSLRQLREWFGEPWMIKLFARKRMELVRVVVPEQHVKRGKRQALFDTRHAEYTEHWPVSVLTKPKRKWRKK